jgi:outer membrane protein TolC
MKLEIRFLGCAVIALLLAGCATPADLAPVEGELSRHAETLPSDILSRPLTVDDAIGLAITYNLDARVKALEEVIAAGKADLSMFALLPEMAAKAGWSRRGPASQTTSKDLSTGVTSTSYSQSEDAARHTADLTLSWNLVDFGIALLRAEQEDSRVRLAIEKRRRATHLLVQDVQAAYWKAVINEFAERKYKSLELKLVRSVRDAETAERTRVGDPMQMLAHQRAIVDTMRQIAELQRQTSTARADLAGLMGVASVTAFQLASVDEASSLTVEDPTASVESLEAVALANRPELKSEAAQFSIDAKDVHTEMLKSIPGIGPFFGGHFDSNSYMRYNTWADAGVKVAWNLVDLLSAPKRINQAHLAAEVTRARRVAVAMAVLTQVHVADTQYRHALKEYRLTEQMAAIDRRITGLASKSKQAGQGSAMEEIKAEASSMLSTLRRLIIYSDLQSAMARLQVALGTDPAPPPEPMVDENVEEEDRAG